MLSDFVTSTANESFEIQAPGQPTHERMLCQLASSIGENINVSQKTETNVDFVSMSANHFYKHSSIVDINNNMNTTAFSFRHTTAGVIFFRGTHKVRNNFGSIFNYIF